jgi:hypothetical protein
MKTSPSEAVQRPDGVWNPLTAIMPNILAWRVGEACRHAAAEVPAIGDPIDRGLILCRMLKERGFELHYVGDPV